MPRGGAADDRPAALRRPADRRHGPERRVDRRDEDRRGQDADRDARRVPELTRGRPRAPGHRQRLPGPPRCRVDGPDLRGPGRERGCDPGRPRAAHPQAAVLLRRRLRDQLGVRLRLPARQHGRLARALRPARALLRDRRRGRQHPHRRGADPADHLRCARGRGRPLLHVRPARQADEGRAREGEAQVARRGQGHDQRRLRLRVRREAQDRGPDRARRREGGEVPRSRQPLRLGARDPRQPPRPVT